MKWWEIYFQHDTQGDSLSDHVTALLKPSLSLPFYSDLKFKSLDWSSMSFITSLLHFWTFWLHLLPLLLYYIALLYWPSCYFWNIGDIVSHPSGILHCFLYWQCSSFTYKNGLHPSFLQDSAHMRMSISFSI